MWWASQPFGMATRTNGKSCGTGSITTIHPVSEIPVSRKIRVDLHLIETEEGKTQGATHFHPILSSQTWPKSSPNRSNEASRGRLPVPRASLSARQKAGSTPHQVASGIIVVRDRTAEFSWVWSLIRIRVWFFMHHSPTQATWPMICGISHKKTAKRIDKPWFFGTKAWKLKTLLCQEMSGEDFFLQICDLLFVDILCILQSTIEQSTVRVSWVLPISMTSGFKMLFGHHDKYTCKD